ncbi:MAG: phosphonate C-P lyase system protein PhnH [Paracoccaceae bacterium]|nr:phosphonate C-P lyase system protein PhnH [Paracoccaceae bacterium]
MTHVVLEGGFNDAPREASFVFRGLMNAMARPGTIETIAGGKPPMPLSIAAGTALLSLADADTPVHLAGATDTKEVRGWLAFQTGATLVGPDSATFAVGTWEALLPLDRYPIGTPEYPDRSATLIVEVPDLTQSGSRLTGPGIESEASLSLPDKAALQRNGARFPLGLDFFFTSGDRIAALPRSTRIG